jgi:hypothetical protein
MSCSVDWQQKAITVSSHQHEVNIQILFMNMTSDATCLQANMKTLKSAGDSVLKTPLQTANCLERLLFHRIETNSLLYQQHQTVTTTNGTPAANSELYS